MKLPLSIVFLICTVPRVAFAARTFVSFENQTSVDVRIARSGDLSSGGSLQVKTQISSENAALRESLLYNNIIILHLHHSVVSL